MSIEEWIDYYDWYINEIGNRIRSFALSHKVYKSTSMSLYAALVIAFVFDVVFLLPSSVTGAAVAEFESSALGKVILLETGVFIIAVLAALVFVRLRCGKIPSF